MAYNPGAPVVTRVEINTALGWVDVTARGRAASSVITQGRSANSIQAETSRLQLTLGNPDGYLTEDNAMSPWYGSWGRGCEIRVSRIGLTVSPTERFHGQVDSIVERYPGGNIDATVEVVAIGSLGILGQGSDALHSPLWRAMMGISAGNFQPIAHWSMEEGSGSTSFASSFPDQPAAVITGAVSPGSYSGFAGSNPLPVLSNGTITAALPSYVDTGIWQLQFTMMIPSSGFTNDADMIIVAMMPGKPTASIYITFIQSSGELRLSALNAAGTSLASADTAGGAWERDTPYLCAISDYVSGGSHLTVFEMLATDGSAVVSANISPDGIGAGTAGRPRSVSAVATAVSSGWSFGQPALITADVLTMPNLFAAAQAAGGYIGELGGTRMIRLTREEGVPFELVGNEADTPAMGPQLTDTLLANLRNCESADQGLMHDNGTDGAIGYVTRTHLYNQTATIAVTAGSIEPSLQAIRDRQYIRNDVTSTRSGGGSARFTDETHVAKIRARLKDSRQPNVEGDDQLANDAAWAVHVGTPPGPRYNSVGINLRNPDGALLADQVAAHAIGDRLTVAKAALPPQHHVDGIDGLTVGWTEILDADTWIFRANVTPYQPYIVGVLNDTVLGRLGTGGAAISGANLASTAGVGATFQFTNTDGRLFTTAAGDFDMDVVISGERIRLSGISGASNPQTGTIRARAVNGVGPKTHLIGAAIQVYQPIVLAL